MSNWLSEYSSSDQKQVDQLNTPGVSYAPIEQKEESGALFKVAAPFRGAAAGFAKVGDAIAAPVDAVVDRVSYSFDDVGKEEFSEPYSAYKERKQKARDDLVYESIDYLQDKENTGTVGNIAFSLGDYATRAVVGSAVGGIAGAAAVTGGSETNYVYGDLTRDGVDEETALKVALTDGAVAAVSTALPMSYGFKGTGGVIKDGLLSVGGASGLSIGGQAASGAILESEGYDKQAKKYEITNESVITDIGLNILFFGAARGAGKYFNNPDVTPEQQQAALVLNELEFDDAAAPVKPANPVQANNHIKNLDASVEAIRMGRPVNVVHPVKGEEKQKPVRIAPSEYSKIRYDDPRLDSMLHSKAKEMDMDWAVPLLLSIRRAGEKSHNWQVSPVGAQSIMQIMPDTKAGLERNYKKKWDVNNPEHATEMALYLVREMSQQYKTKDPLVLAAHYNGGFANGKAMQKNGKPKAQETINYVNRVKDFINTGKYKNYTGNNITTAIGMDGSSYDMAYEVKSLDELIASNDLAYGVNPLYPSELQPRDRTREASRQQIERMAEDLRPELLGESPKLSDGAPIIGMDNVVESGNGRTLAIAKAYESGRAEEYRAFLEQYAAERGIDIAGINNPVLVRTRLTDTDRTQFAKLANESDVAQYSATERAVSDSDRLPDASLLKINNDGSINLDGSMDFVRGFVGSLPKSEQGTVITGDGRLSQEGKRRIESAMMQRTYEDSSLIGRMAENLDDDSKTVLNALLRAAPQLAQLDSLVKQGGRHKNTLAKDLAQAAQKLSDLKANGQTVPDYLNQGQLIDDGLSPGARDFLNVFDQNKRSTKAISDNIQSEIDRIEGMGDPRQGSLFGDGPEESAALDIIMQNPDQQISVSRMRPDGEMEEITMTLRERLDELEAEAKQAEQDTLAAQTAISCALQFGE
ncbi:transglycosylase SLT domain-containing protein [Acinetobacter pseudolwoffii]|uniref:transglycosylase SLT domain-containing protein n=1 Tax=Acinetobacter pseudolwoffii TaxID=2053287 RepID=UPI0024699EE6|nr:transglycosylase SLT domain-containing protein [Acinetobacter pseudolwoffii]MDH5819001.1 transglycosylase SLT domain-containing protein [Acinetobacter pseudolwoffii]